MYTDIANEDENDVFTSEVNILDRHKTFIMHNQGHKDVVYKLPYAYLTVKCHKDPIGSRFIVGVAGEKRNEGHGNDLSIVEKLHNNASTKSPNVVQQLPGNG